MIWHGYWVLAIIFMLLLLVEGYEKYFCYLGNNYTFKCHCPDCLKDCNLTTSSFDIIYGDGVVKKSSDYEINKAKDGITLVKCTLKHWRTYSWVCKTCEAKNIFLLVVDFKSEFLDCLETDKVSFAIPCPEKVESCNFRKHSQKGLIVNEGNLTDKAKYQYDEKRTHITLRDCNKDDEGKYAFKCWYCHGAVEYVLQVHSGSSVQNPTIVSVSVLYSVALFSFSKH